MIHRAAPASLRPLQAAATPRGAIAGEREPLGDARSGQDAAREAVGLLPSKGGTAVACRNLSKRFPGAAAPVLHDVSLSIASNAFFTLLGPSGCGKTTLLRLIAGLETADAGSILVEGQILDGLPPYRRPVNTVFQSYAVFPHLTVEQNIAFGLEMQHKPRTAVRARVAELLALVRLDDFGRRRPAQLSGGQLQRVALARALAARPKVLLLDEPLSALDYKLRSDMQLEHKRLQHETGITFVFVTHDQDEALAMSDRIAVMQAGRIVQIGTPEEIYETPANRFVASFVGEMTFLDVTPGPAGSMRLASGQTLTSADLPPLAAPAVLAIRPEQARLTDPDAAQLAGTIEEIVYTGTDRKYQVMLPGIGRLTVRESSAGGASRRGRGDRVGISLQTDAVRIMPR